MSLREERQKRLKAANAVLTFFASGTSLEVRAGVVWVLFTYRGSPVAKKWVVRRGQSFYPVWNYEWGHGGTATTALSQLVRWIQHRPVLPLSSWKYWAGQTCRLFRDHGPQVVLTLREAGYPDRVDCVRCGTPIESSQPVDWWCLDGVSGPSHWDQDCLEARGRNALTAPVSEKGESHGV